MNIDKLSGIIKNSFQAIKEDMDSIGSVQTEQVKALSELQKELEELKAFNNKVIADILRRLAVLEKVTSAVKKNVVKKDSVKKSKKKAVKKRK